MQDVKVAAAQFTPIQVDKEADLAQDCRADPYRRGRGVAVPGHRGVRATGGEVELR